MAFSTSIMSLLSVLVLLLPMAAVTADIPSSFEPYYEELCKEVNCGKGTCKANTSAVLGFVCECDSGWQRTSDSSDDDDDDFTFLPCVIPNCTLNYNCQPAPPPVPADKPVPFNISAFDPCYWVYCGDGSCVRNQSYAYTHTCLCNSGYSNLLDTSVFPCYSQCTLGSDCANLGIKVSNSTSEGDNNTNTNGTGQASTFLPGKFQLGVISIMSLALVLWK